MKSLVAIACGVTVALATLAPAARANIPDPARPHLQHERWVADAKRRLERELDASPAHQPRRGVAEVRFDVDAAGAIAAPTLVTSSGSKPLDAAMLRAVRRARALKPPPQEIAGRSVLFRLEAERPRTVLPNRW